MSTSTLGLFLRHLALSKEVSRLGTTSDHDLLAAYESEHGQAAFTELIRRHGPMVLRTCRRLLGRGPDAEDAFQATFVLLARKAGQLRREAAGRQSLCGWLHRVAYHMALKVLNGEIRRRTYERQASVLMHPDRDPVLEATWNEIQPILDAELDALPEQARRLLIACYLQGKTHIEAAAELRIPLGSVARHLERARKLLGARLSRRGITVSAALLAVLLEESARGAGVPAVLLVHALEGAMTFTEHTAGIVSDEVARLVKSGLTQMAKGWTHWTMTLAGWLGLLGAGLLACQTLKAWPDQTPADEQPAAERQAQERDKPTRADCYGDPLPVETLARMGTTRLRHTGYVYHVLFAPDGKTVASAGMDGSVRLWDMATGKLVRSLKHPVRDFRPHLVSFVQDGKALAYAAQNQLWLWDARTGKQLHELKLKPEKNQYITVLAVSSDGKMAASVEGGAVIRLWDVASGNPLRVLHGHEGQFSALSFSPDNKTLAAMAGSDKRVQLWDVLSGKLLHTLEHPQQITAVCFAPDGKTLASAGSANGQQLEPKGNSCAVRLWDTATGKLLHTLEGHQQFITSLSFSPDGKLLVSGSWDRSVRLWDPATGKELRQLKGHQQLVQSLGFSPDGKMLVSGGSGAVVRLWDVATGQELHRLEGMHQGFIRSVSFAPDGRTLATAAVWKDGDDAIRLWDAASGKLLRRLEHPGGTHAVTFTTDGKMLASAGAGAVRIWDATTGKQLQNLQTLGSAPLIIVPGGSPLALSPDGKLLAEDVNDWPNPPSKGNLRLWDVASGTQLHVLEHPHRTVSAAFSPDGKTLAVGTSEGTVHLWDPVTGKELRNVVLDKQQRSWVTPLCFSPDGKTLAAGGYNNKIYLLEMSTVNVFRILTGHSGLVESVAFSPNGRLLASGGTDRTVRLWEVKAGLAAQCHLFGGHDAGVTAVAFSPDGRRLASGSHDSTALVWDVTGLAGGQPRAVRLTQGELSACWRSLASTDAVRAYEAMRTLAAADQAVPFLAEHMQEQIRKRPDAQQVARLLAELDHDSFRIRSKATKELGNWGELVEPALRQALKDKPSLEARRRILQLLETMHPDGVSPRLLRWWRVVEVLEWIDNPAARELLRKLAADLPREEVGQEAKDALRRLHALSRKPPSRPADSGT